MCSILVLTTYFGFARFYLVLHLVTSDFASVWFRICLNSTCSFASGSLGFICICLPKSACLYLHVLICTWLCILFHTWFCIWFRLVLLCLHLSVWICYAYGCLHMSESTCVYLTLIFLPESTLVNLRNYVALLWFWFRTDFSPFCALRRFEVAC